MKRIFILLILISSQTQIFAQEIKQDSILTNKRKGVVESNPYSTFRDLAFSVKHSDLELNLQPDQVIVYGVIMDWDMGKTIVTVVAYNTGDASVYLKSGQIFIGGFAHESINNAAVEFVKSAQVFLKNAEIATDDSFPDKGCIKFYFKTNIGIFVHQESEKAIENANNEWTNLFLKGNQIITEYRLMNENIK